MHIFAVLAFIGIVLSLGSALFYLMKDQGKTNRMVNALTLRISLSIYLFLIILLAHAMGWIESTGLLY